MPPHSPRRPRTTAALLASAAFTGFGSTAAASDLTDFRLAVVRDALTPRPRVLRDIVRLAAQQSPQAAGQGRIYPLSIDGAPLSEVISALGKATGTSITLSDPSIGLIYSPGVRGTLTFEEALKTALDGTNMRFRLTSATSAIVVLPALSEDVTVTAPPAAISSPKYSAPLRDIPQTIEVIPRAAMETQGVTTLSEALRNVPGITLQAGEGGGASSTAGDMFNLRGFNASNSLFVDNVRDDGLVSRDVFNLEQIEVFMGPTGSDVGRGTAAGYVNMQTKMPRLSRLATGALAVGEAGQLRTTVDVNQPLTNGTSDNWFAKSAVRMNVLWQDSGVAGRDEVENASKAIAPSAALGLDTPTRVMVAAQFLSQDNVPDYGIPGAAWSEEPLAPTTVQTLNPVDQTNFYGSPAYDYDHANQKSVTARIEQSLRAGWMVSNQTRHNRTERDAVISTIQNVAAFSPTTEMVTIARQGNVRENRITSNQTSLAGPLTTGGLRHSINSGVEFAGERQVAPVLGGVGTRAPVSVYSPNPDDPVTAYAPSRTGAYTDGETRTVSGYIFDSVAASPHIQLNGGVRVERYETTFRSVDAANVTTVDESGSDVLVTGKAAVVVRATSRGNLYASWGTTKTPPGSSNFTLSAADNNQNNPSTEPQESTNFEVGTKWEVADGRLLFNAAVFHTINKNVLVTLDATATPPVYNQDDKQRVDGIALGATGQMTPAWNLMASFAYLDSENQSQLTVNNGNRLLLTPEFSGSVWSTYRLPKGWTLGGGIRATSRVYINAANTIDAPGYYLADGLVEYAVNRNLTLRLNIYNMTDQIYIRNVNNNGGRYNPGNPRTVQLTSVFNF
jgi:catecholate siderophore receptor